jgi:peptidoglycan LD-endopeptidase LytH
LDNQKTGVKVNLWFALAGLATVCLGVYILFFSAPKPAPAAPVNKSPVEWSVVEAGVRDRILLKDAALGDLKRLRPMLDGYYAEKGCEIEPYYGVFPVAGGRLRDANIKGYFSRHYDFFSGKNHRDHPAVDIFIHDSNHDCLDDKTKQPVNVVSLSPGIVVSVYSGWQQGNLLRGGNSAYVYDPVSKGLFYYAHMSTTAAAVGDIVKPGDVLGTVGRTGTNAFMKRSPTHLHIMYLKYPEDGYPKPENVTDLLIAVKKKQQTPVNIEKKAEVADKDIIKGKKGK